MHTCRFCLLGVLADKPDDPYVLRLHTGGKPLP